MFDASGKSIPDGLLIGNLFRPGSYYSCLDVRSPNFGGKYVFAQKYSPTVEFENEQSRRLKWNFGKLLFKIFPLKYGFCLPDSCSDSDIKMIFNETFEDSLV